MSDCMHVGRVDKTFFTNMMQTNDGAHTYKSACRSNADPTRQVFLTNTFHQPFTHRTDLLAQLLLTFRRTHSLCCSLLVGQRGKWATRTIRFESNGFEGPPCGTPLGGFITWKSKRLFPREQQGISIADIAKVEHDGKVGSRNDEKNNRPQ